MKSRRRKMNDKIDEKLDEIENNADKVARGMHTIAEGSNVPDDCMNVIAALRRALDELEIQEKLLRIYAPRTESRWRSDIAKILEG
jgi:hypothetical protein